MVQSGVSHDQLIISRFLVTVYWLCKAPGQTMATCQCNISRHCWVQHVTACCARLATILGVVGSNFKMFKFSTHLWMLRDVVVVWPGSCNVVAPGHTHYSIFNNEHFATFLNRVTKRAELCYDRLAGALYVYLRVILNIFFSCRKRKWKKIPMDQVNNEHYTL